MDYIIDCIYRLYNFFFLKEKLYKYEKECIESWKKKLDYKLKNKIDDQIKLFDYIQRQTNKIKTVFFLKKSSQKKITNEILFKYRDTDKKVAEGILIGKIEDVFLYIKFSIYIHEGRLFSIEFSSEPGSIAYKTTKVRAICKKTLDFI